MLEIRGIWLCHMSRWDRYVLRPRVWVETPRSGTVPPIGPYSGFGGVDLWGWLATTIFVTSGTGWSILILELVLGTLAGVVACLTTLVAGSKDSAGRWVVRWRWVERSWWTRRHIGWPRWVVPAKHAVGDPDLAFL